MLDVDWLEGEDEDWKKTNKIRLIKCIGVAVF